MKKISVVLLLSVFYACNDGSQSAQQDAQKFIDDYTTQYVKLYTASQEAQWKSNIEIIEGDSTNAVQSTKTGEALASFTGGEDVIKKAKAFTEQMTFVVSKKGVVSLMWENVQVDFKVK